MYKTRDMEARLTFFRKYFFIYYKKNYLKYVHFLCHCHFQDWQFIFRKEATTVSQIRLRTIKFPFKGTTLLFILVTINSISTSLKLEHCWNIARLASNFTLSNTSFTTGFLLLNINDQETFNLYQTREIMTLRG